MNEIKELEVIDQSVESDALLEEADEFDDKAALAALRRYRVIDVNMVRIFFAVLFIGAVIALIPILRPEYSESEQRKLEKFPKFSVSALFSGDLFSDFDRWFSDTFPFRDTLITLNGYVTNSFGKSNIEIHGDIEQGDAIPEVDEEPQSSEATSSVESEKTESVPSSSSQASSSKEETPSSSSQQTSSSVTSSAPAIPIEQIGAVLIANNSAYEYYNFKQDLADIYSVSVSRLADKLAGQINVYDIVVPTSTGITLPDEIASKINSSNQKAAIDYIYSKMSANVKKVDAYSTLKAHSNEYVYFRTDHHWTALGAYYTYCELMKTMGRAPNDLSMYNAYEFKGFLGSFYRSTGKSPKLAANPDTVFAYGPKNVANINITVRAQNGQLFKKDYPIIRDGNAMNESSKYLCFIAADQPLGVIVNPAITDGSVCLVVKESYGNCFVPFLAENYGTVYVVDYRHYPTVDSRNLYDFALQTGTKDIIFINNLSATRNKDLVWAISTLIP